MGAHHAPFGAIIVQWYGKGQIFSSKCIFPMCTHYEHAYRQESMRKTKQRSNLKGGPTFCFLAIKEGNPYWTLMRCLCDVRFMVVH